MKKPNIDIDAIRQHHLFSSFTDDQLHNIVSKTNIVELKNGQLLFRQGQKSDYFYMVTSGNIKLFLESPNGDQKIIEVITPGRTFAVAALFMEAHRYPVYSEAIGKSTLYAFQSAAFMNELKNNPDVCFRLIGSFSQKLQRMVREIESLSLENATHRLIRYLLQQIGNTQSNQAEIQLPISKQALASRLSIQPETLSRMIKQLADKEILCVKGRVIEINDIAALKHV